MSRGVQRGVLDVDVVVPGHGPITEKRGVESTKNYWLRLQHSKVVLTPAWRSTLVVLDGDSGKLGRARPLLTAGVLSSQRVSFS